MKYKYLVYIGIIGLLIYLSIEIRPLDHVIESRIQGEFDPAVYAQEFWNDVLPQSMDRAVDASLVLGLLQDEPQVALEQFGRSVGVGAHYLFLTGEGRITEITDGSVYTDVEPLGNGALIEIATDNIFDNAVRDATGLIDVNDFPSSRAYNNISVELNKIIQSDVIPGFLSTAAIGKQISFHVACELSGNRAPSFPLRVIPIKVEIIPLE